MLLCSYPSSYDPVANGVRSGLVEVARSGDVAVLDDGMVEMAVEGRLDSCHVLHLREVPHGDLLLAVPRALRGGHCWARLLSQRELCREVVREAALVDSAKQPRPRLAVVRLLPVKQDIRCGKLRAPPPATFRKRADIRLVLWTILQRDVCHYHSWN